MTTLTLPQITSRLSAVTAMSDADLAALETSVVDAFDEADARGTTPESVELMKALSGAHDQILKELQRRDSRGRMATLNEQQPRPAPASRHNPAGFNAAGGGAAAARPTATRVTGRGVLRDRYKNELVDERGMADALTNAMKDARSGGGPVTAFSASWRDAFPEDRRLSGDPMRDSAILDKQQAIVASGGICNPVNVDYSVEGIAVDDRPLRDGLPSFLADRGGLRYTTPVQLASTAGATGIWTQAIDANPGTATKPIITLNCPTELEVFVDAVPTRIKIGNMQGRFYSEWVENFTGTALAAAARVAETNLLQKISTGSTAVSSGQLLGASRDFVATVEQAVAAARYRQRARDGQPFTVVLPEWAKAMMRADLAREHAHDTDGGDPLAVSDARIQSWFSLRSLTPVWTMDSLSAVTGGAGQVPFASQQFGAQAAGSALLDWPHQLVWWVFPSGSWQLLDGGLLNLGVVRDSLLDGQNDFELMVENFETVAFRGLESLQVISTVRPNGASAATVSTSTY